MPGTAYRMSRGPSMPQYSVAPDLRTTALIHCDLMPRRVNASNCSSPDGASVDDPAQQRAAPSSSVEVHREVLRRPSASGGPAGIVGQPRRIGHRRGDARGSARPLRVEPLAAAGRRRRDSRRRTTRRRARLACRKNRLSRPQPRCSTIAGLGVDREELAVQSSKCADRGSSPTASCACVIDVLRPVVVDAVDDLRAQPIAENRIRAGRRRAPWRRRSASIVCGAPRQVNVKFLGLPSDAGPVAGAAATG